MSSPAEAFYGGGWGTGDPIDGFTPGAYDPDAPNASVAFGTQVEILNVAKDNTWAVVHIRNK
jgi:hypothetical protein